MCAGAPVPVLHDFEPALKIPLEPVDSVELMTLIDNVTDVFMPDQGPARRPPLGLAPTRPSALMEEGRTGDPLIAEHGFAMLVTVTKGDRTRRLLYDTGTSPDGVVENMRRLGIDPGSIEAIVCSHGPYEPAVLVEEVQKFIMHSGVCPGEGGRSLVMVRGESPVCCGIAECCRVSGGSLPCHG